MAGVANASLVNPNSGLAAIARYNTNGTLDATFANNGKLTDYEHQVASTIYTSTGVQSDGKIVAAGYALTDSGQNIVLARYNSDGTFDTTFSHDGKQSENLRNSQANSVAIQSDGKIIVSGDSAIGRYNTIGNLDTTFRAAPSSQISTIAIQTDGKIAAVGLNGYEHFTVTRYNSDGTFDRTFSEDGKQQNDYGFVSVNSIAIQRDGKIVVAGSSFHIADGDDELFALARYNTDGTLDKTFAGDGILTTYPPGAFNSIAIQSDGKIVVAGNTEVVNEIEYRRIFSIFRINGDGTIDSTFSRVGIRPPDFETFDYTVSSLKVQNDGKILVAGSRFSINKSYFSLVRYNSNGSLDSSFGENGIQKTGATWGNDGIRDIAIFKDKLYAVGTGQNPGNIGIVARYFLDDKKSAPPTVSLTNPTNHATYLAPAAHIKLSATASDADGTITKVEFYNGTHLLHTEYVFPYGFVWKNVGLANYTLTAKAYDNSGLVTTSAPVHVSIVPNKPPTVSIIKPKNNQPFAAPGYIHFEADAKDVDGRITRVEFYNGSTLLRTEYKYPYTYVWKNVPAGTYTNTAVATDNWGAQTTSAPVTVRVIPQNPQIVSSKSSSASNKTGTNDAMGITLAPNPVNGILTIHITTALLPSKQATVSVISSSGVEMKTTQINGSAKTVQLDVSSLVSGVYTVKLISGGKVLYKQFVKM